MRWAQKRVTSWGSIIACSIIADWLADAVAAAWAIGSAACLGSIGAALDVVIGNPFLARAGPRTGRRALDNVRVMNGVRE